MKQILVLFTACVCIGGSLYAQQEQPSAQYIRSLNSYVSGSPETSQMMKYVDFPVSLYTGTPQIDLPIYTLTGKGISLPLSLSYHAGGGVKVNDLASNCGLGWLLQTGGEISREIRGLADETASIGFINKAKPLSYYDSIRPRYADDPLAMAHYVEWADVAEGRMDLEPDIFYFNFGGFSGKFIYDELSHGFKNMNISDRKLKFNMVVPGSNYSGFTITTDDGTRYIFNNPETSTSQSAVMDMSVSAVFSPSQVTAWKLSKIVNADATDSIQLYYDYNEARFSSLGSSTTYLALLGANGRDPVMNVISNNTISGLTMLKSIVSRTDSVSFVYDNTYRRDYPLQRALSRVIISSRGGHVKNIFRLHTSYFQRDPAVGPNGGGTSSLESLRLDSLYTFGSSENNTNPLRHRFTYNPTSMPARMSFAQDMWGYANNNTFYEHLAPGMYMNMGGPPTYLEGADRRPDEQRSKAGILEKIELPTGGSIEFEYEGNTVNNPSLTTAGNIIGMGKSITKFMAANQLFASDYIDSFDVNQPPDEAINGLLGGVTANVSIMPAQTDQWSGPILTDYPYYGIERAADPPPAPTDPHFDPILTQGPASKSNFYLPNGKYYIKVYNASKMNRQAILGTVRAISFSVDFLIRDTTVLGNQYRAGGLRIKSITSKDYFSAIPKVRTFTYGNANAPWGRLIGPKFHSYLETRISNSQQFFVRMGNNNMPGQNTLGSAVVYPKVVEAVQEGNQKYKTYHTFLGIEPTYFDLFPFVPGLDNEYARGKEIMTEWTGPSSLINGVDQPFKRSVNVYDYSAALMPSTDSLRIGAIKTAIDAYSNANQGAFPMFTISTYSNNLSHVYLTSDSTFDYSYTGGNVIGNYNLLGTWNSYTYGNYNNLPLTITTQNSKGDLVIQKNGYAADAAEPALATDPTLAAQLKTANRVSDVLASRTYKNGTLLNQMQYKGHFSGNSYLVDSVLTAEYNNALETEAKIPDYDTYGNPLTIEGRGGRFRKYLWRKERNLPLATCTMPKNGAFVFTSFEYPNEYSTIIAGNRTAASAFCGTYAYNLNGSLIFQGFNTPGNIEVYAWLSQGSFTANGVAAVATGRTKDNWTLYRAEIPYYPTVTVGGFCTMDQLAIVPAGSDFDATVYDEQDRIQAKVNSNMQNTFFEYDGFGRLQTIKDEQGNILKNNVYQYQSPQ